MPRFSEGIENDDIMFYRRAFHMQVIGSEGLIGVPDGHAANDDQLRRNVELFADDIGIRRQGNLTAAAETTSGERQQQRLHVHAHAHRVRSPQIPVNAHDGHHGRPEKLPVPQHGGRARLLVLARDPHGAIHHGPELLAVVLELLRQRRHHGRHALGLHQECLPEAVAAGAVRDDDVPRLDVGVRGRALRQRERFHEQLPGHGRGEKFARGVASADGVLQVVVVGRHRHCYRNHKNCETGRENTKSSSNRELLKSKRLFLEAICTTEVATVRSGILWRLAAEVLNLNPKVVALGLHRHLQTQKITAKLDSEEDKTGIFRGKHCRHENSIA